MSTQIASNLCKNCEYNKAREYSNEKAREILAKLTVMTVSDSINQLTQALIFGKERGRYSVSEQIVYCSCENCVHDNVRKCIEEMRGLTFAISEQMALVSKELLSDVAINCRRFHRKPSITMRGTEILP